MTANQLYSHQMVTFFSLSLITKPFVQTKKMLRLHKPGIIQAPAGCLSPDRTPK